MLGLCMERRVNRSAALLRLSRVVDEFRHLEQDFPASYAAVLLCVARHEDDPDGPPIQQQVADELGLSKGTISRIVMSLGDRRKANRPAGAERPSKARAAFGLIERKPDALDLRIMRLVLTPRGRGVVSRLLQAISPEA